MSTKRRPESRGIHLELDMDLVEDLHSRAPRCVRCGERPAQPNRSQRSGFGSWCTECRYEYDLWRWYRLTREDYDTLLIEQCARCAICTRLFGGTRPHVDHDHACAHPGKGDSCCRECVRGLLCGGCNHFAEWIETRMHLLAPALRYLGIEIAEP